jgi:CobQ-like glutamine amidotransferase family enzyme
MSNKMKKTVNILHLYPEQMNIYGDWGNVLTLQMRLKWYGYNPKIIDYNLDDEFPEDVDIIVGGGGQDSGQGKIQDDLLSISDRLHDLADKNTPMLVICGMYQLFGKFFETLDHKKIKGISIFDIETYGGQERLIGNIITKSRFGELVGYENHSGQTFLGRDQESLGEVVKGAGNNSEDNSEGAVYKNVFGSYLHGSLLPKNPKLADFLIEAAVINKFGVFAPDKIIDDKITDSAREFAARRGR